MNSLHQIDDHELDQRIERKLRQLGLLVPDSWLTATQAAEHARISKAHFLRLLRQGRGPDHTGVGKLLRLRRSSVDRWLDRQSEKNATDNSKLPHACEGMIVRSLKENQNV